MDKLTSWTKPVPILHLPFVGEFIGEFIGTFILVFFGCSAVCVTVLFASHTSLFQIAAIWGMGVSLAIYTTRHMSCAHLNPAVSLAMVAAGRMTVKKLPAYLTGQFSGAFFGAAVLYLLFNPSMETFEALNQIQRGMPESIRTAMIFGEFYPNPANAVLTNVTMGTAVLAEGLGTFFLVFLIFSLTEGCNVGRPNDALAPLFIGSAVALIIAVVAPLTQAGLNPARDISPRIFAYFVGWGNGAMPDSGFGFIIVYGLGPVLGGLLAALVFRKIIEPILLAKKVDNNCNCAKDA